MFLFEKALVFHASPTLSGLKPANLLSLSKEDFPNLPELISEYTALLTGKGIAFSVLCDCNRRWLLLVFRSQMLRAQLSRPSVRTFLAEEGYPDSNNVQTMLSHLRQRLISQNNFPHEIGIFLGYPLADVLGFRKYKGECCKLCGYWKVYGDAEQAKQCFDRFDRCRSVLFSHLLAGTALNDLVATFPQAA